MNIYMKDWNGSDTTLDAAYFNNVLRPKELKTVIETSPKFAKTKIQRQKRITEKQWRIYYYLLAVSVPVEESRIIQKESFNISKCCKFLEIKSTQTFYNAIEALKEEGLISENGNEYVILTDSKIEIDLDIVKLLLTYSMRTEERNINLLRVYIVLKEIELQQYKSFILEQIINELGFEMSETKYYEFINYLGLLCFWNFIQIEKRTSYNEVGEKSIYYVLNKINERDFIDLDVNYCI